MLDPFIFRVKKETDIFELMKIIYSPQNVFRKCQKKANYSPEMNK